MHSKHIHVTDLMGHVLCRVYSKYEIPLHAQEQQVGGRNEFMRRA